MDFCRQCASEENRERATKSIESIESIAHSKKRMDVFPRPPTDRSDDALTTFVGNQRSVRDERRLVTQYAAR